MRSVVFGVGNIKASQTWQDSWVARLLIRALVIAGFLGSAWLLGWLEVEERGSFEWGLLLVWGGFAGGLALYAFQIGQGAALIRWLMLLPASFAIATLRYLWPGWPSFVVLVLAAVASLLLHFFYFHRKTPRDLLLASAADTGILLLAWSHLFLPRAIFAALLAFLPLAAIVVFYNFILERDRLLRAKALILQEPSPQIIFANRLIPSSTYLLFLLPSLLFTEAMLFHGLYQTLHPEQAITRSGQLDPTTLQSPTLEDWIVFTFTVQIRARHRDSRETMLSKSGQIEYLDLGWGYTLLGQIIRAALVFFYARRLFLIYLILLDSLYGVRINRIGREMGIPDAQPRLREHQQILLRTLDSFPRLWATFLLRGIQGRHGLLDPVGTVITSGTQGVRFVQKVKAVASNVLQFLATGLFSRRQDSERSASQAHPMSAASPAALDSSKNPVSSASSEASGPTRPSAPLASFLAEGRIEPIANRLIRDEQILLIGQMEDRRWVLESFIRLVSPKDSEGWAGRLYRRREFPLLGLLIRELLVSLEVDVRARCIEELGFIIERTLQRQTSPQTLSDVEVDALSLEEIEGLRSRVLRILGDLLNEDHRPIRIAAAIAVARIARLPRPFSKTEGASWEGITASLIETLQRWRRNAPSDAIPLPPPKVEKSEFADPFLPYFRQDRKVEGQALIEALGSIGTQDALQALFQHASIEPAKTAEILHCVGFGGRASGREEAGIAEAEAFLMKKLHEENLPEDVEQKALGALVRLSFPTPVASCFEEILPLCEKVHTTHEALQTLQAKVASEEARQHAIAHPSPQEREALGELYQDLRETSALYEDLLQQTLRAIQATFWNLIHQNSLILVSAMLEGEIFAHTPEMTDFLHKLSFEDFQGWKDFFSSLPPLSDKGSWLAPFYLFCQRLQKAERPSKRKIDALSVELPLQTHYTSLLQTFLDLRQRLRSNEWQADEESRLSELQELFQRSFKSLHRTLAAWLPCLQSRILLRLSVVTDEDGSPSQWQVALRGLHPWLQPLLGDSSLPEEGQLYLAVTQASPLSLASVTAFFWDHAPLDLLLRLGQAPQPILWGYNFHRTPKVYQRRLGPNRDRGYWRAQERLAESLPWEERLRTIQKAQESRPIGRLEENYLRSRSRASLVQALSRSRLREQDFLMIPRDMATRLDRFIEADRLADSFAPSFFLLAGDAGMGYSTLLLQHARSLTLIREANAPSDTLTSEPFLLLMDAALLSEEDTLATWLYREMQLAPTDEEKALSRHEPLQAFERFLAHVDTLFQTARMTTKDGTPGTTASTPPDATTSGPTSDATPGGTSDAASDPTSDPQPRGKTPTFCFYMDSFHEHPRGAELFAQALHLSYLLHDRYPWAKLLLSIRRSMLERSLHEPSMQPFVREGRFAIREEICYRERGSIQGVLVELPGFLDDPSASKDKTTELERAWRRYYSFTDSSGRPRYRPLRLSAEGISRFSSIRYLLTRPSLLPVVMEAYHQKDLPEDLRISDLFAAYLQRFSTPERECMREFARRMLYGDIFHDAHPSEWKSDPLLEESRLLEDPSLDRYIEPFRYGTRIYDDLRNRGVFIRRWRLHQGEGDEARPLRYVTFTSLPLQEFLIFEEIRRISPDWSSYKPKTEAAQALQSVSSARALASFDESLRPTPADEGPDLRLNKHADPVAWLLALAEKTEYFRPLEGAMSLLMLRLIEEGRYGILADFNNRSLKNSRRNRNLLFAAFLQCEPALLVRPDGLFSAFLETITENDLELMRDLGRHYSHRSLYKAAEDLFAMLEQPAFSSQLPKFPRMMTDLLLERADSKRKQLAQQSGGKLGDTEYKEGRRLYEEALRRLQEQTQDNEQQARILRFLALYEMNTAHYKEAAAILEEAWALLRDSLHTPTPRQYLNRAWLRHLQSSLKRLRLEMGQPPVEAEEKLLLLQEAQAVAQDAIAFVALSPTSEQTDLTAQIQDNLARIFLTRSSLTTDEAERLALLREASQAFRLSLQAKRSLHDYLGMAMSYLGLGQAFSEIARLLGDSEGLPQQEAWDAALDAFSQTLALNRDRMRSDFGVALSYQALADLYLLHPKKKLEGIDALLQALLAFARIGSLQNCRIILTRFIKEIASFPLLEIRRLIQLAIQEIRKLDQVSDWLLKALQEEITKTLGERLPRAFRDILRIFSS